MTFFDYRGVGLAGKLNTLAFGVIAFSVSFSSSALAGDYKVYSPNVVKGEKELEMRGFNSWGTNASSGATSALRFAAGFAPTDFWATELYVNYEQEPGEKLQVEEYEWENRFQLNTQGKYWADLGLLTELEIPRFRKDPYGFKLGPIVSKDIGRTTVQFNLLAGHQYGTNAGSGVELSYRARLQYRYTSLFSPLVEAYGQPVGKIGHWGSPRHQLGAGFSGRYRIGGGKSFRYSAVLLSGVSQSAADLTGVMRLEYEFF